MRFVFWHNCLSPHQLPYIKRLIDDDRVDEVVFCAPCTLDGERIKLGWSSKETTGSDNLRILISPSDELIRSMLENRQEETVHVFSGIRPYKFVFSAFLQSLNYNVKRVLISEGPYTFAMGYEGMKPLWMHKIRFLLRDRKYVPYLHCIFGMGQDAVDYFKSVVNDKVAVYDFCYCTESILSNVQKFDSEKRIIFIGNLCRRKGVDTLIKSFNMIGSKDDVRLTIIGGGADEAKLKKMSASISNNIEFKGVISQNEIQEEISRHDILVLPSRHDGWGAVVNEALQQGLYVVCSNHCGAKDLFAVNSKCGTVFEMGNPKELSEILSQCILNINTIREEKNYRKKWSMDNIDGSIISKYFIDCVCGIKILPPWKRI